MNKWTQWSRYCYAFDCERPAHLDTETGGFFCDFHDGVKYDVPRSIRREWVGMRRAKIPAPLASGEPAQPRAEGAVKRLWDIFDEMSGRPRPEVLKYCIAQGFKPNTATTQFYYWRTGRVGGKKPGEARRGKGRK